MTHASVRLNVLGNALHDSYDKDDIPVKTMSEIRKKYVTDSRFTPEAAEKASKAAAGMCKWVYAMETYDRVAKVSSNASAMSWCVSKLCCVRLCELC